MRPDVWDLVVCPDCQGALHKCEGRALCQSCAHTYPIEHGIPQLAIHSAKRHDQARFHDDHVNAEFEITRPHGAPELYRWYYAEKFRRSISKLGGMLNGATVLTVCGGSGMDGEFLARAGAKVIASDISPGASRRTQERARRFHLEITPIVADVERLPFRSESVDFVYVHDGLHHLEEPLQGLREMLRVAKTGVSISEPSQAAATAMAIRFGLALEYEEAGNRVGRVRLKDVASLLELSGFQVLDASRYAMYFRHEPGKLIEAMSRPLAFPLAIGTYRLAGRVLGRLGNKATVQAIRVNRVSGGGTGNSRTLF